MHIINTNKCILYIYIDYNLKIIYTLILIAIQWFVSKEVKAIPNTISNVWEDVSPHMQTNN